jgi:sialate O-acetylesterase
MKNTICGLCAAIFIPITAQANVRLPSLFSDHMVIQCDMVAPIWGWADAGESVSVSIGSQTKTTTANQKGKWSIKLDKLHATEPATLTVKGKNTITINDVLIGEVWIASGQSNMQMQVNGVNNAQAEIAKAAFPQIRMFMVERRTAITPQEECNGKWLVCNPENVTQFSATAYFFGRDLHQTLHTPVGLINTSWGGTSIEAWTSNAALDSKPELSPLIKPWELKSKAPFDQEKANAQYQKQLGLWKVQAEKAKAEGKPKPQEPKKPVAPRLQQNYPGNLFNGMVAPLIPYAIRGGIWYPGEANGKLETAALYRIQLPLLVTDWRTRWNQGDFPFAWVQLPNFKEPTTDPGAPSGWALVRESMLQSLKVPHTGMAVIIDSGETNNIHPKNKQVVGKRLALWARAQVYGEKILFSGPLFASHKINGNDIVLTFTHNEGLKATDGELKGFAIADASKKWLTANAKIVGDTVVVSHPDIKSPTAVRYSWADNPNGNLSNKSEIPASPFRTDDW